LRRSSTSRAAGTPHPIHVDAEAAATGPFGQLIASGVHTLAIFQRLAVLGAVARWRLVGGRGVRDIELTAPVLAGDVLHGRLTVLEVQLTRPDRSLVVARGELTRDTATVLTLTLEGYVARRRAG
jgi:acyl dehydratase